MTQQSSRRKKTEKTSDSVSWTNSAAKLIANNFCNELKLLIGFVLIIEDRKFLTFPSYAIKVKSLPCKM